MKKKQLNILLVDDNEKFLKTMAERARLKGFNVLEAGSGSEALKLAEAHRVDVAVVDQRMPEMEGLAVIEELRKRAPRIRTVLLTGHGDVKLKEATEAVEAVYFEKQDMGRLWTFLSELPLGEVHLLLVDDNPRFLEKLAERLRLQGHEPFTALNGAEALKIAASNKIHIAVVDQRMPDMDGLTVIEKLQQLDPDVKTLLLTGHGDAKLKQATEALNAAYFEKEDMGRFWKFVRRALQGLERTMAAAGMATGGDIEDAVDIESHPPKTKRKKT